jgi:hypothetical protein
LLRLGEAKPPARLWPISRLFGGSPRRRLHSLSPRTWLKRESLEFLVNIVSCHLLVKYVKLTSEDIFLC